MWALWDGLIARRPTSLAPGIGSERASTIHWKSTAGSFPTSKHDFKAWLTGNNDDANRSEERDSE